MENEFNAALLENFKRFLKQLRTEVESFEDESALWRVQGEVSNSPGNLALHIAGNLQHFIGAVLGDSGYVRKRDEEFSRKNVPKEEILIEIAKAKDALESVLPGLTNEQLNSPFPLTVIREGMSTQGFLMHLLAHLCYHQGQINYQRRLLVNPD